MADLKVVFDADKNLTEKHFIISKMAENAVEAGLKSSEIIEGIKLSHGEYIRLVALAKMTTDGRIPCVDFHRDGTYSINK